MTATQLDPLFFCKVWVAVMLFTSSPVARLVQVAVVPDIDKFDVQLSQMIFITDIPLLLSDLPLSAYDVTDSVTLITAAIIAETSFLFVNVFTSFIKISSSFFLLHKANRLRVVICYDKKG